MRDAVRAPDEYGTHDAVGLAALVAAGEVSADALLDAALARVEALNPALNAVVHLREGVARRAIAAGLPDGPLTGVPFLLKDLGAEARDFPTHSGSRLMADSVWAYDSEMFLRLKRCGLVSFGRTCSPEFGVGPVTEARVYGGPTRNPWNLSHTSGGSSGGAGAAVAAGIVPAAHGSDGGGSVRIPASACGLVGFKPTRARLPDGPDSGEGWAGMAVDGFLTRSMRDTAALLDAVAGPDVGAPYHPPPMRRTYTQALARPPKPLRVRFTTKTLTGAPIHADCAQAVTGTAHLLASLGHAVEERDFDGGLGVEAMMLAWTKIVACGNALTVRGKLAGAALNPDLLEPATLAALRLAETVSGADYLECVEEIHAFGRRMAHVFDDCDVLLTATMGAPPAAIGQYAPHYDDFIEYRTGPTGVFTYSPFTVAFNASGQPCVSLPLHWNGAGLPVGVHLAAAFGEDERLMALCGEVEQAAPWNGVQQGLIARGGIWAR